MGTKIILAYSGGLDTSVAIPWLIENYDADVVTLTIDLGGGKWTGNTRERAIQSGATKALVVDARDAFIQHFVFPALQAGSIYQGQYPLATALGRPLIARYLVEVARTEGADTVAHGCTGKGNDQVRFDLGVTNLEPSFHIVAPAREWGMTRDEEIAYAKQHNIPLSLSSNKTYSVDENLWGRSIEAGDLEDPWIEPPEAAFSWTNSIENTPDKPLYLEVSFEGGIPVAIDHRRMDGISLIQEIAALAGEHGIGRIDHLEDRLVGIKSRELYEAPAATVLHTSHRALESAVLNRDQIRFKERVSQEYADLVYNGLWYTKFREDLSAYITSTQRFVTGTVRLKLYKGRCNVVGRASDYSLYRHNLATYDTGDTFDQSAAPGFIHIYGLAGRTQVGVQAQHLPDIPPAKEEW